jgi:hypothetical protein
MNIFLSLGHLGPVYFDHTSWCVLCEVRISVNTVLLHMSFLPSQNGFIVVSYNCRHYL